jgi:hypothetical protein
MAKKKKKPEIPQCETCFRRNFDDEDIAYCGLSGNDCPRVLKVACVNHRLTDDSIKRPG